MKKLTFETVSAFTWPMLYTDDKPNTRPELVPDKCWHTVETPPRENDEIDAQYAGLEGLIERGEYIRNVKMYSLVGEWVDVTP